MKSSLLFPLRLIAFWIAMIFCWDQIVWAGDIRPSDYVASSALPTAAASFSASASATLTVPVQAFTTTDFLADKRGPLSPATQDTYETIPQPTSSPDVAHYEYERYDFQDALDLLRPEFAAAVIVKEITAEDLKKLAELPFETGVIVLRGEIVLFSSGSENKIGILPAASQLIQKATFVSHTHPGEHATKGPSEFDLIRARDQEYVVETAGVYIYDRTGLLNEGKVCSYEGYVGKLNQAVRDSLNERNQVDARKDLSEFIAGQDFYNKSADREIFRRVTPLPAVRYFYNSAGNLTRTLTTTYNEGGKAASVDDCRFSASFKTNCYYTVYDPAGVKTRYTTTTYHPDGQTAKVIKDEYYTGGIKAGYSQATYNAVGAMTQDYNVTYYPNGTTLKTIDDYRYANNLRTFFYQTSYDSAGLKTCCAATTYHPDGQTVKVFKDEYYEGGVKTGYSQVTSDAAGVKTQDYDVTYHSNGTTAKTIDDYRYANNLRTFFYQTSYDSAGLKTRYTATTYHPDGQTAKMITDSYYVEGIRAGYNKATYATTSVKTQDYNVTYHPNGTTTKTIDDYRYTSGIRSYLYQTVYDPAGVKIRYNTTTFQVDGVAVKSMEDLWYAGSIKTKRYFTTCDASGFRTHLLIQTFYANGKIETSDDYDYAGARLTKRILRGYSASGVESKVLTENYPSEILTNNSRYVIRYAADGSSYEETLWLAEGPNLLRRTVMGYNNESALLEWKIALDTMPPEIIFTSTPITNQKNYTLTYTADGIAKTKAFADLAEGENVLSVTETDAVGNQATANWNVRIDTIPPEIVITSAVPGLTNDGTLMVDYTADGIAKQKPFALTEGDNAGLTIDEEDAAGNVRAIILSEVVLDTIAPEVLLDATTPRLIDTKNLTVLYTSDGSPKTKTFTDLVEGENTLSITETDSAGNQTIVAHKVTVNTIPFEIIFTSPQNVTDPVYRLTYTAGGVTFEETRILSKEGENVLAVTKADAAGNVTQKNFTVILTSPDVGGVPDLGTSFSLTTTNGEVLNYLNGQLSELELADGSVAKRITLNADGNLLDAFAMITDGSLEVLEGGTSLIYRRPDGSHAYYDQGELKKVITKDGLAVLYSYLRDTEGNICEVIAESDIYKAVYEADGKLKMLWDKRTNRRSEYENGLLVRAVNGAGNEVVYVQVLSNGEYVVTPDRVESPAVDYTLLRYDAQTFMLKEAHDHEGRTFSFENGRVKSVLDSLGNALSIDFAESSLANITDFEISQNGLVARYNAEGQLASVMLNDLTIHYRPGSATIDFIEKQDGAELHDLVFDANGGLMGAVIMDSEGTERTYQNGKLVRVVDSDAAELFFQDDRITKLITSEELTYHFNYTAEGITASLDPASIPVPSTVVLMEYDQNMTLKKVIKQNQEIISFMDDRPFKIEAPDEVVKTYSYEMDAQGVVVSTKITQGNAETFLDTQGQPVRSLIRPTEGRPDTFEVIYKYGKIREVYKNGMLTFRYSYQFDVAGAEQTVIEDLEEKAVKIYQSEKLLTSLNVSNKVLSSYSYTDGKISRIDMTRLGKNLHTYVYAYQGDHTIVTDETSVVRTYADGKLIGLQNDSKQYSYAYAQGANGAEITIEDLVREIRSNGDVIDYEHGKITKITQPDGGVISDITKNGDSFDALLTRAGNAYHIVKGAYDLIEKSDGSRILFEEGLMKTVLDSLENTILSYSYQKSGNTVSQIVQHDPIGTRIYDVYGDLISNTLTQSLTGSDASVMSGIQLDSRGQLLAATLLKAPSGEQWGILNNSLSRIDFSDHSFIEYGSDEISSITSYRNTQLHGTYPVKYSYDHKAITGIEIGVDAQVYASSAAYYPSIVPPVYVKDSAFFSYLNDLMQQARLGCQGMPGYPCWGPSVVWRQLQQNLLINLPSDFSSRVLFNPKDWQMDVSSGFPDLTAHLRSLNQYALDHAVRMDDVNGTNDGLPVLLSKIGKYFETNIVSQEFSANGDLETQIKADGTVTLFEGQKPIIVMDALGAVLIEYGYDDAGNPKTVYLKNAREVLPEQIIKVRAKIEEERQKELLGLANQKQLATEQIKSQADSIRTQLRSQIDGLSNQRNSIQGQSARGKAAKKSKSNALDQVQNALNQAWSQWEQLHRAEADAYAQLDLQVQQVSNKIEADSLAAFLELDKKEAQLKTEILRQEVSPIIYDHYRRILGRDPTQEEYNFWISRIDYNSGEQGGEIMTVDHVGLYSVLSDHIQALPELAERQDYVAGVKRRATDAINHYLNLSPTEKNLFAASLGLSQNDLIDLTPEDAARILSWLNSRSLHFGQSAFLSLENLLDQQQIAYDRQDLAAKAILIDILTGVISPLDDGELLLSVHALHKTARLYGLTLSGAKIGFEDLQAIFRNAPDSRVIAHINGNHFVIVTALTDTSVTYIDPGIGKDKQNESLTVTRDAFLEIWNGNVLCEQTTAQYVPLIHSKALSDDAMQRVRGAFWGSLLNLIGGILSFIPVVNVLSVPFLIAGFVTSLVEGDWLSAISSVVSVGFLHFNLGGFFEGAFHGIANSLGSVGTFFGNIYNSVTGFLSNVVSFLPGIGAGVASQISAQIINTTLWVGATYGLSQGLVSLGVSPEVSGFMGSLVAGAVIGAATQLSNSQIAKGIPQADFIKRNVLQTVMLNNVGSLGMSLRLNPAFTSILGLSLGAIQGNVIQNPGTTLEHAFKQVLPNLTGMMASCGIASLGTTLGLDAAISALIGAPFSASITGLMDGLGLGTGQGGGGPGSIFNMIKDAILSRETMGGIFSVGAGFVMDRWGLDESLLGSLSSRLVAGILGDFFASPLRFSFADSIIKSMDESFYEFFDPALLSQFFASIANDGLADGIERYATMLFTRGTLNEFASAGMDLGQWIETGMPAAESIVYDGESAKLLRLAQNSKTVNFVYVPKNGRLELQAVYEEYSNGRRPRLIQFATDDEGNILRAFVEEQMPDGTFRRDMLNPDGKVQEVILRDWDGEVYGRLSFNAGGELEFTNYNLGISDHLSEDGRFTFDFTVAPDFRDLDSLLYDFNTNLSAEDALNLASFSFGNGFWNERGAVDATSPLMMNFIDDIVRDQARNGEPGIVLFDEHGNIALDRNGNVLTAASLPITLYAETGLVGNILRWTAETWFGARFMRDEIERELTNYLDLIKLNQEEFGLAPNMGLVHFAHSGDFQPMIQALEHMPDEYRSQIKTLVAYDAPYVGDGIINDTYLETLIRVRGEKDGLSVPFTDHRQFQIADENGALRSVPDQYSIEILGAGHSDFSCASGPNQNACSDFINQQTNLFMRDLTLTANDPTRLKQFLSSATPGVIFKDGIVQVDPRNYVSPNGDRS